MPEENEWPGQEIKNIGEEIEPDKELKQKYRHILINSEMGREVLRDILLAFCHYGQFLEYNQAQIAEHNVGVSILIRCGIMDGDNIENSLNGLFNSIGGGGGIIYRIPEATIKKRPRGRPKGTKTIKKEVER